MKKKIMIAVLLVMIAVIYPLTAFAELPKEIWQFSEITDEEVLNEIKDYNNFESTTDMPTDYRIQYVDVNKDGNIVVSFREKNHLYYCNFLNINLQNTI